MNGLFCKKTQTKQKTKPKTQQQPKIPPQNCSFDPTGQMKSHGDGNKEPKQVRQVEAKVIRSVGQLIIASAR